MRDRGERGQVLFPIEVKLVTRVIEPGSGLGTIRIPIPALARYMIGRERENTRKEGEENQK